MAKIIVEGVEREMTPNEVLLSQIAELEAKQTPRRFREAVKDPTWINALDEQIAALRAQLTKETTNG